MDNKKITKPTNVVSSIPDDCLKGICKSIHFKTPFVENLFEDSELFNQLVSDIALIQQVAWKEAKQKEPVSQKWIHHIKAGKRPSAHSRALIKNFLFLSIENSS